MKSVQQQSSGQTLNVALWSVNLSRPITSLDGWLALVEQQLISALNNASDILVLPEYFTEHWLSFSPANLTATQETPWMAEQALLVMTPLQQLCDKYQIALQAGTVPFKRSQSDFAQCDYVNRAYFFTPNQASQNASKDLSHKTPLHQDKLSLTPSEKDPQAWDLVPGDAIQLMSYKGVKIAILICLDVEMPALSVYLAPLNIDIILVPSMTSKPAGFYRVFGCAKARAIELQVAIAAVGPVGKTATLLNNRTQFSSGAAVYLPCEESLGHTGVAAQLLLHNGGQLLTLNEELLFAAIDIAEIRRLRNGSAEVWPGGWSAEHITIKH